MNTDQRQWDDGPENIAGTIGVYWREFAVKAPTRHTLQSVNLSVRERPAASRRGAVRGDAQPLQSVNICSGTPDPRCRPPFIVLRPEIAGEVAKNNRTTWRHTLQSVNLSLRERPAASRRGAVRGDAHTLQSVNICSGTPD